MKEMTKSTTEIEKFPTVLQKYVKEIMSCHNGRSRINIRIHKRHAPFLNSNGKDFLKHLKLYY